MIKHNDILTLVVLFIIGTGTQYWAKETPRQFFFLICLVRCIYYVLHMLHELFLAWNFKALFLHWHLFIWLRLLSSATYKLARIQSELRAVQFRVRGPFQGPSFSIQLRQIFLNKIIKYRNLLQRFSFVNWALKEIFYFLLYMLDKWC